MRRGHETGTVHEPRPGADAGADDVPADDAPQVVALRTDSGRSWEDLLSEAVDDDAPAGDEPAGTPSEQPVAVEDGDEVELPGDGPSLEAPGDGPTAQGAPDVAAEAGVPAFGELIAEIVLPGGRRLVRYRLPQD